MSFYYFSSSRFVMFRVLCTKLGWQKIQKTHQNLKRISFLFLK